MTCAACSTPKIPSTIVQTKIEHIYPPGSLLTEPAAPVIKHVVTNRDILDNSDAFAQAYENAVAQIKALRDWYKSQVAK